MLITCVANAQDLKKEDVKKEVIRLLDSINKAKLPDTESAFFFKIKTYLMRIIFVIVAAMLAANSNYAQNPAYKNTSLSINQRIDDLLSRMTLDEKVGQLNQLNGGVLTGPEAANDPGQKGKMQLVKAGKVGSFLNVIGVKEIKAVQKIAVEESRLGIPILFAWFHVCRVALCNAEPKLTTSSIQTLSSQMPNPTSQKLRPDDGNQRAKTNDLNIKAGGELWPTQNHQKDRSPKSCDCKERSKRSRATV